MIYSRVVLSCMCTVLDKLDHILQKGTNPHYTWTEKIQLKLNIINKISKQMALYIIQTKFIRLQMATVSDLSSSTWASLNKQYQQQ